MIDRRDMLKWGAAAPILASGPYSALAAVPEGLDALVVDTRFADAELTGLAARRTFAIDGDVTALWYNTLDTLWRKPGFVLGGITGTDALFVLERLALDCGRRVVNRTELRPAAASGVAAISWVIAPVHPSVMKG
ncbi:MAG: hypothetical protein J7493_11730 [Porphyrobacter sp.]|nr:hypothetical protein [Porphyrobacter sp.]